MALAWLSLLKTVPWSDVISNAPLVADGAKKLWNSVGKKTAPATHPVPRTETLDPLQAHIAALEASSAELRTQLRAATELLQTLAQQNTELVQRVEAQRVRLLWHSLAIALLAAVGLLGWLAYR